MYDFMELSAKRAMFPSRLLALPIWKANWQAVSAAEAGQSLAAHMELTAGQSILDCYWVTLF